MNSQTAQTLPIRFIEDGRTGEVAYAVDISNRAKGSLTDGVLAQQVTEDPFIWSTEMFHVEKMGNLKRHFVSLGRAMERDPKRPSDLAHIHALAEELAHLAGLALAETRCDAAGVVAKP